MPMFDVAQNVIRCRTTSNPRSTRQGVLTVGGSWRQQLFQPSFQSQEAKWVPVARTQLLFQLICINLHQVWFISVNGDWVLDNESNLKQVIIRVTLKLNNSSSTDLVLKTQVTNYWEWILWHWLTLQSNRDPFWILSDGRGGVHDTTSISFAA